MGVEMPCLFQVRTRLYQIRPLLILSSFGRICKDSSKKFCPSCGNPTLLRASVTISSSPDGAPTTHVHLKKNFQYKTRGTIYPIPYPKPGSAKTGSGEGLILREDQNSWMLAQKRADDKKERDDRKMLHGSLARQGEGGAVMGSWMDPDWIPEIIAAGASGKGRKSHKGDMPTIGYGRKNPNERRRKK
jgi:RNA-binding protein NOB1